MSRRCSLTNLSIMSGNNVSHSNRKTKRRFIPNLKHLSLFSNALGVKLKLKVATSTLRTINKYGDIDNFLINYRYNKLSILGQNLRHKVRKSLLKSGKLEDLKIKKQKIRFFF